MINTWDNLSNFEMLNITGGLNDQAIVNTVSDTAGLVASIASGQPIFIVAACFKLGYDAAKIFDDNAGGDSEC